jgi:phosphoglycolate phosphatase
MPAPVLVLDLDGTLVDTASDLVETLNVILAAEGVAPLARGEAVKKIGHGAKSMLEAGLAAQGVHPDPQRIDTLYAAFIDHYEAHLADQSRPFPGAEAALERFAADGWRLAICTNKLERLSRRLLGELGLADRFDVIAGQDTYGVKKPDPRHILMTIAAAGGDSRRSVMVGDTAIDIDAARAADVPSVAVSFGYSPVAPGALGADRVIDHYDELFAAVATL